MNDIDLQEMCALTHKTAPQQPSKAIVSGCGQFLRGCIGRSRARGMTFPLSIRSAIPDARDGCLLTQSRRLSRCSGYNRFRASRAIWLRDFRRLEILPAPHCPSGVYIGRSNHARLAAVSRFRKFDLVQRFPDLGTALIRQKSVV